MASVSKVILIDTKTGQRGLKGQRQTSFNQRCEDFTTLVYLEQVDGEKSKPVTVVVETSSDSEHWKPIHEVEVSSDKPFEYKDLNDHNMLCHLRVSYDEDKLYKKSKDGVTPVGHLHAEVCFRDMR